MTCIELLCWYGALARALFAGQRATYFTYAILGTELARSGVWRLPKFEVKIGLGHIHDLSCREIDQLVAHQSRHTPWSRYSAKQVYLFALYFTILATIPYLTHLEFALVHSLTTKSVALLALE